MSFEMNGTESETRELTESLEQESVMRISLTG